MTMGPHLTDMKRYIYRCVFILLAAALCGCVREQAPAGYGLTEGDGVLQMSFGAAERVQIETRATLGESYESQIKNFYVFVFGSDGRLAGSQFFDSKNRKTGAELVTSSLNNSWYVDNTAGSRTSGQGVFRMKTAAGENMKVYLFANLDEDIFSVSSDLLANAVKEENDLKNFTGELQQLTVNRNGFLTMSGMTDNVSVQGADASKAVEVSVHKEPVTLRRLTSKIRFVFQTGSRPDERGQVIKSFKPGKWKVVNVPRTSYLLSYAERGVTASYGNDSANPDPSVPVSDYSGWADDFFNTDYSYFEDFPSNDKAGFSFYMLENRQEPKKKCRSYQDRSRCVKDAQGHNGSCTVTYEDNGVDRSRDMRLFEYANDFSAYVVVTGKVEMELKGDPDGTVLGGDVQYIIHLGDWSAKIDSLGPGSSKDTYSGYDNFNVERNTSYTYTVTVNSVNSIRVEVSTSNDSDAEFDERQPGATGDITVAKEEIAICDSHYSSRTFTFSLGNFFGQNDEYLGDNLTWFVETPFSSGGPEKGLDNLDYKWVRFRLNKQDSDGNYLSDRRKYTPRGFVSYYEKRDAVTNKEDDGTDGLAGYHNDGAMDVVQLVAYIKNEVQKYRDGKDNAFDHKASSDIRDRKIRVTAFIDEYYYDQEPVRPYRSYSSLWKKFVNKDDRKMHILSNSEVSRDLESMVTASVITIQQKSIVSIFSTDEDLTDLTTAWGIESVDEFGGSRTYWSSGSSELRGNDSDSNGLLNTCIEWGLYKNKAFSSGVLWGEFVDWEKPDDVPLQKDEYNYLRYACLTRNRDNNGDGRIDRSEVRWYLASINQLLEIFFGNDVLDDDVRLYNRTPEEKLSDDEQKWQQHIVSSTSYTRGRNSNNPTIVWAEEGISTGNYDATWQHLKKSSVRCVRNLGFLEGISDNTYSVESEPQQLIQVEKNEDGNFSVSAKYLNDMCIRYYTSGELPFADEYSVENRLYRNFEIYKSDSSVGTSYRMSFKEFNDQIDRTSEAGKPNPFCPDGYRSPNQREIAVMRYYLGKNKPAETLSRTYWSFGPDGLNHSGSAGKYGFIQNNDQNLTVNPGGSYYVRCIRDVRSDRKAVGKD